MADFDSIMDAQPTGFETPEPAPQAEVVDDPIESTPEVVEPAEGQPQEDEGDLLDDEPPAAATAITEAAEKWKAIEDSPDLPPELGEKLWTVKPNGREMQVTIEELGKGYMRLSESTRRSQELDAREHQLTEGEQRYARFFESIKDPQNFLEVFERQLGPEVLDRAMAIRQERAQEDMSLIEASGLATMRRLGVDKTDPRVREAMIATKKRIDRDRQLEIEKRKLEVRTRELESRTKAEDTDKRVAELRATFERQLAQLVPTAFKAHRIRDNAANRARHTSWIQRIAKAQGAPNGITRELVAEAAKCLREEMEDERAARQPAAAPGKVQPRASKGAGGGVAPTRGHVGTQPKKLSDFDDHFGL